ncbi:MAG: hypothetical protein JWO98_214 [Frankiales bacterium]|nr:hypothetical protein [Frankiales bacterium]
MKPQEYELSLTTQGPLYPPSEVLDPDGNFLVIGKILTRANDGTITSHWGSAVVAADTQVPPFGELLPYRILRDLDTSPTGPDASTVLHTLPLPLPATNYPMLFAPEQCPQAHQLIRPSYAFHEVPIPDFHEALRRPEVQPVTLGHWLQATGELSVEILPGGSNARFTCLLTGLIPNSLYTFMSLRAHDLDPDGPTRPLPLGVPNVLVTDEQGNGSFRTVLVNPFPAPETPGANRVVNVILLWMSYRQNYAGAIGQFGLGGDVHAQLKLKDPGFFELVTRA